MHRRWRLLGYGAAAAGFSGLSLLALQVLLGRRLEQAQIRQLGSEVTANLLLGEVALERLSPVALSRISGMRLVVGGRPGSADSVARPADPWLRRQARQLHGELCRRLPRCPAVWPTRDRPRGVWVEMGSPLEAVWLFVPLPALPGWPPDPLLLVMGLASGALGAALLFQALEVQRPLALLEQALGAVGLEQQPAAVPGRGTGAVRQLTVHVNAMVARLEEASRERRTMLAGIAHDLRAPLTRLRLRLELSATAPLSGAERALAEADIAALERITRQFLLFAGVEASEAPVLVPLEALLAETAAIADDVVLDLEPLVRLVRPIALARAVANLIDNAHNHGAPPFRLELRGRGATGFEIAMWDGGVGIPAIDWERALVPFQRLDAARGEQGHSGLGLAIAARVARDHGGELQPRRVGSEGTPGFAVVLRGRSDFVTSGGDAVGEREDPPGTMTVVDPFRSP